MPRFRPPSSSSHDESTLHDVVNSVLKELERAEELHPVWPGSPFHGLAILQEEVGELTKATLQCWYDEAEVEAVRTEAIQTAAMALRFLINLDDAMWF